MPPQKDCCEVMNSKNDVGTNKQNDIAEDQSSVCYNYSSIPSAETTTLQSQKNLSSSFWDFSSNLRKWWSRQSSSSSSCRQQERQQDHESSSSSSSSSFLIQHLLHQPAPRQILILLLLLALAFGSIVGVVPAIVTDRYARLNHGYQNPQPCWKATSPTLIPPECLAGSGDAQNVAAWENFVSNGLTFITSSVIGSISDERGRRGIIILGLSLNCLSPLCLLFLQIFPTMSPTWYYVASGSSGLVNWVSVTLSALADVLPPHLRAAGFGILLATFSLGFALSPILAAILDDPFHVTIVCCSLMAVAWIWTYLSLPETVDPEVAQEARRTNAIARREWNSWGTTEVCGWKLSLAFICRPIFELSILNRSYLYRLLSALAFFSGMVGTADRTLLLYYVEERLSFNNHDVAVMFMLSGILGIVVQGILIKPLIGCFGERYIVVIAFVFGFSQNVFIGLAHNKAMIFASTVMASFCGMSFPTISSIKSMNVTEAEQGRIQGALYSLQALAAGLGPLVLRIIYHYTKESTPGAMFLVAAAFYLLAASFAWALPPKQANSSNRDNTVSMPHVIEPTSIPEEKKQLLLAVELDRIHIEIENQI